MKKMKIAIVDDNIVFRKLTKIAIEHSDSKDVEVLLFENGQEAFDYIKTYIEDKEQLPKVILLDLNMPVMDGWQFLEETLPINKSHSLNLVIYIVSSSNNDEDIERAKTLSDVKGYLVKPINITQINSLIAELQ
ncbi:response regulator [Pustulibacterium marinum]|nr:response regulator [Pustulibacterium marinum]